MDGNNTNRIKKIVLAYSGGLDTSIILKWLKNNYNAKIIAYIADVGQEEDFDLVKEKAVKLGASIAIVDDLKLEFASNYIFPMIRANAIYEGSYLLGTAIARPLIAKRQIEIAKKYQADAVSHGATAKGNDQLRFEYSYAALAKDIKVISPWRIWDFDGREDLVKYALENQISIPKDKRGEAPFSIDANLLHTSCEGKDLEDPAIEPPEHIYQITKSIYEANKEHQDIEIEFNSGDAIALNNKKLDAYQLLLNLNQLGSNHGIGRIDMLETRTFGTKSRGTYETPGGTILLQAHRAIEQLTLDGDAILLKDQLMPRYAKLIYNGLWFTKEREMLQALINTSQKNVSGKIRLRLHKGRAVVIGRESSRSLYDKSNVSFENEDHAKDNPDQIIVLNNDQKAQGFNARDTEGYIKINSIMLSKNN